MSERTEDFVCTTETNIWYYIGFKEEEIQYLITLTKHAFNPMIEKPNDKDMRVKLHNMLADIASARS